MTRPVAIPGLPLSLDFDIVTEQGWNTLYEKFHEGEFVEEKENESSAMIAFDVSNDKYLESLADKYEDRISDLHMTLLFLGDISDIGLEKDELLDYLERFANVMAPIEGKYGGVATFSPSENSDDKYPHVLLYDAPGLPFFVQQLRVHFSTVRPEEIHGFIAHTTLAYVDNPDHLIDEIDYNKTFDTICLYFGDEKFTFPLTGDLVVKGGEGSGFHGHAGRPGKIGGSQSDPYWSKFNQEGPTYVYHGTTIDLAEKIFKDGMKRGKSWHNRNPSVYFTVNREEARTWSIRQQDESGINYALIKFKISDILDDKIIQDPIANEDFGWNSAFRVEQDILAENIVSIDIGSIHYVRDTSQRIGYRVEEERYRYIEKNVEFGYTIIKIINDDDNIVEKQLPIDEASKANLIQIRTSMFNSEIDVLSERMYIGDISIGQWEESMKKMLRELHTSVAAIGKGGWDQMTWADWGRLGPVMKDQYRYLHGFAEKIATDRETISLNYIKARAKMYGNAAGYSAYLVEAGDVFAAKLPWLPKDGSTECLVNCRCRWELEIVGKDKDFNIVEAVWKLGIAEHCPDCIDRDGYTTSLRVHKTVVVPKTIGGY